jgi:hypothetical protein
MYPMNPTAIVQKFGTKKEAREQLKLQLAHYLERQPESTRLLHKWMKCLDVASLGVIAAAFIVAMVLSIAWESINPLTIPVAWFVFAASPSLTMVLVGLHAMLLRAFPPIVLPGKTRKFITGRTAVWAGLGTVALGLVAGVFWGSFVYAVGTYNLTLIVPLANILGILMGIAIIFQLIHTTPGKISKSL